MSGAPGMPPLPDAPGTYRWLYTDVVAGEWTAVCIFMVGAVFSPRYAARPAAAARPREHCAVNVALSARGVRRAWAFTEYPRATLDAGCLRIGRSRLAYEEGGLTIEVDERTAPWGTPLRARFVLDAGAPSGPAMSLDEAGRHRWQALMPRARASLAVPTHGVSGSGLGYHDTNEGDERLGERFPGWRWARLHGPAETLVGFRLPDPAAGLQLVASDSRVAVTRAAVGPEPTRASFWRLALPRRLSAAGRTLPVARVLESSPFYARQESASDGWHALGEVADFRRFRSPLVRWMAHFRMRVEAAA